MKPGIAEGNSITPPGTSYAGGAKAKRQAVNNASAASPTAKRGISKSTPAVPCFLSRSTTARANNKWMTMMHEVATVNGGYREIRVLPTKMPASSNIVAIRNVGRKADPVLCYAETPAR